MDPRLQRAPARPAPPGDRGAAGRGTRERPIAGTARWAFPLLLLLAAPVPAAAQVLSNTATGRVNGIDLPANQSTVALRRALVGPPGGSAEVAPNRVRAGTPAQTFTLDVAPALQPGDPGLTRLVVAAPAGFAGIAVTSVTVGGAVWTQSCPAAAAATWCATAAGETLTVDLGTPVWLSGTRITVAFTADVPNAPGPAAFAVTVVSDIGSGGAPAGNADGDPSDANSLAIEIEPATDATLSQVTVDPPRVRSDGVEAGTITVRLRDAAGRPVAGRTILLASDRGGLDSLTQPAAPTDSAGVALGAIRSTTAGTAHVIATDVTEGVGLADRPPVVFIQEEVLSLEKTADRTTAIVGAVVGYSVAIRNRTAYDAVGIRIEDSVPQGFRYLPGTATLDGSPIADPTGDRVLAFAVGTVPGRADLNGNGQADPGEPGFRLLRYRLVVGAGAPRGDAVNSAVARDDCAACVISNTASARVRVEIDPVFGLGTIVGRVFEDTDGDGRQGRDEAGIAGARVALDEGTFAVTDVNGLYHFPAVMPGQRLVKVDANSLPRPHRLTSREAQILTVSPGLLARGSFGVAVERETLRAGHPGEPGLRIIAGHETLPLDVRGNAGQYSLLVNGRRITLPGQDVRLRVQGLQDVVEMSGARLGRPIEFAVRTAASDSATSWRLTVWSAAGREVRSFSGHGVPPATVTWDGETAHGGLITPGEVYLYQLELEYPGGIRAASARRVFGVNRTQAMALSITGDAFETGRDRLSPRAVRALAQVAAVLRRFPDEKILVEGHTDSVGSEAANLNLSKRRAEATARHLVEREGIVESRLVLGWYGESRPVASNATALGRELNRRVEVRSQALEVKRAAVIDAFRTLPSVRINGDSLAVDERGRFAGEVADSAARLEFALRGGQGDGVAVTLPVPRLEITAPSGERVLAFGASADGWQVAARDTAGRPADLVVGEAATEPPPALEGPVSGRTDPGNEVEIGGRPVPVDADGGFQARLPLTLGDNVVGVLVRAPSGMSRLANLRVAVRDREADGRWTMAVERAPDLVAELPPAGTQLTATTLRIRGTASPGDRVEVNGVPVAVRPDGGFAAPVQLAEGRNRLLVEAISASGLRTRIERDLDVDSRQLFFMMLADGVVGRLQGAGFIENASTLRGEGWYSEGRIAYYLKGWIAGKYLVTSAFDSRARSFKDVFRGLDETGNDRLLASLDPDRMYPVYGDSGLTVYDAQSLGRFYLGVESEDLRVTVGNVLHSLEDAELATFRRALYGGHFQYRSLSRTRFGEPATRATLIGAEIRQEHVRDELRGTGGSLYYLSHPRVIEGSEQVSLSVRDASTGLVLLRVPQRRNLDYTVKYEEGRLLFLRPIASVLDDPSLVNSTLLHGNPLWVEVDYETRLEGLEKSAVAGQVRQFVGDHVGIGGTYVRDELGAGRQEISGVHGEVRASRGSRLTGEYATSRGSGTRVYTSADGGLSFSPAAMPSPGDGRAWKGTADLDVGEWFGAPGRARVRGYARDVDPQFLANGLDAPGTRRYGATAELGLGTLGSLSLRHDREAQRSLVAKGRSRLTSALWSRDAGRWGLAAEFRQQSADDSAGAALLRTGLGAGRVWARLGDRATARLEQQVTTLGPRNDQTTVGLQYQLLRALALEGSATRGTLGRSARGGATWTVGEATLYALEQTSALGGDRRTATVFGASAPFDRTGRAYSEHQWEHAGGLARALSVFGAEKAWRPAAGVTWTVSGELARARATADDTRRTAVASRLSLALPTGLEAYTHQEARFENGTRSRVQVLTHNQVSGRLGSGFTALAHYRLGLTRDRLLDRVEARFEETGLGLAYRPIDSDRLDLLARVTRLSDQRAAGPLNPDPAATTMDVASIEGVFLVRPGVEWVAKDAVRRMNEGSAATPGVSTLSTLTVNRVNWMLYGPFGVGVEHRLLVQREARDRRSGWANELNCEAAKHLRFGVGYNFSGFSDDAFSLNDTSLRGWYVRAQGRY
jgi:uncharacterized repeat protein (TIGR01451 family)